MKVRFDHPAGKDPDVHRGMKVPYGPTTRRAPLWRWYLILCIVLSPLLYFLFTLLQDLWTVSAPGIVAGETVTVSSPKSARIRRILIEEGGLVQAGQTLIRLEDPGLRTEMERLLAQLDVLEQWSRSREPRERFQELETRVELHREKLSYAQAYLEDIEYLFEQGAAPRADLRKARSDRRQAALALSGAREALQRARRQADMEATLRQYAKEREMLQAELRSLQAELPRHAIHAPSNGSVQDVLVDEGQNVASGARLAILSNMQAPRILAYLDPKHMDRVRHQEIASVELPSGERIMARISGTPKAFTQLPDALISTLQPIKGGLVLTLLPVDRLPEDACVPGLPVKVLFSDFADLFSGSPGCSG